MALDSSVVDGTKFNPLATNKFSSRQDVVDACHCLFKPLLSHFSPGKARVQLDASGSTHDRAACDLEGWARPLFGIVPMVVGGDEFEHWDMYREGLKNGTDPNHTEYWGEPGTMDQRHVEATALGLALMLVPDHIWKPLDEDGRRNVAKWLLQSRGGDHPSNNHMYFRVIVDLGLQSVGVDVDESMTEDYLTKIEALYIDDGWYRDGDDPGDDRRIDYYNPWAMHTYGLLYAKYCPRDHERGIRFISRARKFAQHFQHWFADTGSNVPFGRSLTYRFCAVAFWGALALVGDEALPWGVMKGLYLRNLRWWALQPISRNEDGLLTAGYAYPNQLISERYSSTGSPYWAMKAFLPLALPGSHPFWAAEELPMPAREEIIPSKTSGMVFIHQPNHTILLVSGVETGLHMRGMPEKYKKFAYSSRYGFSVESDPLGFQTGAFDNMIAFSDDGVHYRVREHCIRAKIAGDRLYSLWRPWRDVTVETWLIPHSTYHIRVHRVISAIDLTSFEGGFAVPRTDFGRDERKVEGSAAMVISKLSDFSSIADASRNKRTARVVAPHGNTNVMFPRTLIPQLEGEIRASESTVFACVVSSRPGCHEPPEQWMSIPEIPTVEQCEAWFAEGGSDVTVCAQH